MSSTSPLGAELEAVGIGHPGSADFLRGILAGCGDCIKILDLDGRLQFMSEGGKRVMEVDDFSVLKGCPWPDFWAGEGNAQAHEAVKSAKAGGIGRFKNAANTARGTPRYWDVQVSPIHGPDGQITHLLSISRDITEEQRAVEQLNANLERQKFFAAELVHRVKNALTTVLTIGRQTFRGEQYKERRDVFASRIKSLSDAYGTLTEASWTSTAIGAVVENALLPYRTGTGRFTISGPEYKILPAQALTLALAINELATNAVKYGALSQPQGQVQIWWTVGSGFNFEWREVGGPPVIAPERSGFGSRLIREVLASDFGGKVDIRYDPTGVVCTLAAPVNP